MLCAVVFIGAADILHHAGARHIAEEDRDLQDALQQRPHEPAVLRNGSVGDELSDEELGQKDEESHGDRNTHDHADGHDDAEDLVPQLVIQPFLEAVHLLLFFLFAVLRHLLFGGLREAAVAVLHGLHEVEAAPHQRALPVPRHMLAVVLRPCFHLDLAVWQPARHGAGICPFHHHALDERLTADLGHVLRVLSGLFCHMYLFPFL